MKSVYIFLKNRFLVELCCADKTRWSQKCQIKCTSSRLPNESTILPVSLKKVNEDQSWADAFEVLKRRQLQYITRSHFNSKIQFWTNDVRDFCPKMRQIWDFILAKNLVKQIRYISLSLSNIS